MENDKIKHGDLTELFARKSAFEESKKDEQTRQKEVAQRIKDLYEKALKIVSGYPMSSGEGTKDIYAISLPHRLTPPVGFNNQEGQVLIELREMTAKRSDPLDLQESEARPTYYTYGVRVEIGDDSIPSSRRRLFDIHSHMINTFDDRQITPERDDQDELEKVEVIVNLLEQKLQKEVEALKREL